MTPWMRIDDGHHLVVGLALDDANQYDQTESRIEQWVDQSLGEIHELLQPPLAAAGFWAAGRTNRTDFLNRYHRMTL
ncbi:hypothetical protein [Aeromonas enterica]